MSFEQAMENLQSEETRRNNKYVDMGCLPIISSFWQLEFYYNIALSIDEEASVKHLTQFCLIFQRSSKLM